MRRTTELFQTEGKSNVVATIHNVSEAARDFGISTVVVFASEIENVLSLKHMMGKSGQIVAVTFPSEYTALVDGRSQYVGIRSERDVQALMQAGIMISRGVLPFSVVDTPDSAYLRGAIQAFGLMGGGTQLCIQAVLIACDAGNVNEGERCIAMCADTALVLRAGHSYRFGRDNSLLSIEHIICKPVNYQITRPKAVPVLEETASSDPIRALNSGEPEKPTE